MRKVHLLSLDVGEEEGRTVMVYMFIARITMAEGSDVKIGFLYVIVQAKTQEMELKCVPVTHLA